LNAVRENRDQIKLKVEMLLNDLLVRQ